MRIERHAEGKPRARNVMICCPRSATVSNSGGGVRVISDLNVLFSEVRQRQQLALPGRSVHGAVTVKKLTV